ncbi:MAG TPA: sigma-70 family RNA polymerase sigma factor [Solirubrobacterales bacterium]|nr:sigma-70 family RNA polymerase sigma factor [Solirubrobacterales bacterium]
MHAQPLDGEAIAASLSDPRAFGVIFERHFDEIHGYLRRRLDRQLADELASQTFLVAFDGRARFDRRRADARPWLFGIATNLTRNHRRREIRELRALAELAPEAVIGIEGVEARVDAERRRGALARALADLPAEEADVLLLLVWAELDQGEIAEALGIPPGTVKSRLSRARRRLRDDLEGADDGAESTNATAGGARWTT